MDILAKARQLESTLARSLDDAARRFARPGARQPLEIMHAVVQAVEARVEPAGRGAHIFPFNRINVLVLADGREARSRFEAVFAEKPSLEHRIMERLQGAGCDVAGLRVETAFVASAEAHWVHPEFHLAFDRIDVVEPEPPPQEAPAAPEQLKLTVVTGTAQKAAYVFALSRIDIGRCIEVRDSRHRLLRTNHVAFVDGADSPNHTVSRRHAHIDHLMNSGGYRLCDDGSAQGTSVIRNGKTIPVPTGSRGVRLHSGDEIILGEARVRVKIG